MINRSVGDRVMEMHCSGAQAHPPRTTPPRNPFPLIDPLQSGEAISAQQGRAILAGILVHAADSSCPVENCIRYRTDTDRADRHQNRCPH